MQDKKKYKKGIHKVSGNLKKYYFWKSRKNRKAHYGGPFHRIIAAVGSSQNSH